MIILCVCVYCRKMSSVTSVIGLSITQSHYKKNNQQTIPGIVYLTVMNVLQVDLESHYSLIKLAKCVLWNIWQLYIELLNLFMQILKFAG